MGMDCVASGGAKTHTHPSYFEGDWGAHGFG